MPNRSTDGSFSFDEYKRLTQEEREFFIFQRICKIDDICDSLESGQSKFAAKWVEHAMMSVVALVASGLVGLGFTYVGNHLADVARVTLTRGG